MGPVANKKLSGLFHQCRIKTVRHKLFEILIECEKTRPVQWAWLAVIKLLFKNKHLYIFIATLEFFDSAPTCVRLIGDPKNG